MTSFVRVFVVVMFAVAAAAGQVTTIKNDIPEGQYLAADAKAEELLKTANYRSVWTKEYLEDRAKPATLQEKKLREVIQPNKWRTVEETLGDKPSREERIWVDKALYVQRDDKPWQKFSGGGGGGMRMESGQVKNQYRYLPAIDFDGIKADFYEHISVRTANKFSQTDFVVVRYVRTTRVWYSADGKILKKTEETAIEGREEMLREVTTYEYDPKDLKIEAPVIK